MKPKKSPLEKLFANKKETLYRRVMAGDTLRADLLKAEDNSKAEKVAAEVIHLGSLALAEAYSDEVYDAIERAYITRAPNDFHCFLIALEWNRPARDRFYQPRMQVLRPVADAITDMMVHDVYDIVMLSMPVRVGKSTLGLLALAWCAGRRPSSPILASGYAEKITKMFYDAIVEVYNDSVYTYHKIFPQLDLVNTSANDLTLDFRDDGKKNTRKYKTLTCRAIEASLTGAVEAEQLLYCDDLVKNREEALNTPRVIALRERMVTDLFSRVKSGCKQLHIGTRWSIHDPLTWVENQNKDNPRCKIISIPALDFETDESNFDYPYNKGFDTEFYRAVREVEDDVMWNCMYQQSPIEREGLLFPSEDLTYVNGILDIVEHPPDDIFAFCDVAFGGGDYLALPIAYQWGDDPPVIADCVFHKGDYKVTEPLVAGTLVNHNVARAVFEANNGGEFYSRDVDKLVQATGHKMLISTKSAPSNKSKETRIIQHSPAIKTFSFLDPYAKDEAGNYIASPMYRQFIAHLTTYTMSGKNLNDDAPDSLAGLAAMLRTNLNAVVEVYDRRHI